MGATLASFKAGPQLLVLYVQLAVTVARHLGVPQERQSGDVISAEHGSRWHNNAQRTLLERALKPPDSELSRNIAQWDSSKILEILARRKRGESLDWNSNMLATHQNNIPSAPHSARHDPRRDIRTAAADGLAPDDVADLISSPGEGPGMVRDALHNGVASLQLRSQLSQDHVDLAAADGGSSSGASPISAYLPYILAGAAVCVLTALVIGVYCLVRSHRQKNIYSGQSSPSPPAHIPRQICLYPEAKPCTNHAQTVQPDVTQICMSPACTDCITPVHTPPLRIKKGLLERRGSNASLTLDLAPQGPEAKTPWGSPPKECSTEEYLTSAGNRMSRKQLRSCLKNVKALHEEFWEIPMNHYDRIEVPGAGVKNRYRTIIPNERTRVFLPELDDDVLSSYINANYIRGYAGEPRAFIATQGPMTHTVEDFWRMVWLQRVPIIIMITKLKEKNKSKCECYLPEREGDYGGIKVRITRITEREGYILRQLLLTCGEDEMKVFHYWYTAWPDHKAPDTARQLLGLVKEVEKQRWDPITQTRRKPVVVHCSAGIGRTGCFIATSIGMQQLREEHMVDILGIVCNMRLDRGGMVQTNEQYVFVHQALCLYEKELPQRPPSGE